MNSVSKIKSISEMESVSKELKKQKKTIAFTNGCFDLFHYGHLETFMHAKRIADYLVVAVNSNESIKRIKGEKRPIIDEKYRALLIAALECVDFVVIFSDNSPVNLIDIIKPDYYLKGSDWKEKKLPEEDVVIKNGGEIHYIDLIEGLSTSIIIDKVMEVYGKNGNQE